MLPTCVRSNVVLMQMLMNDVYHGEQHELMLCLSISLMKLITYNVFGKYGSLFSSHYFWTCVYIFAIPTQTHNSYGWYFSVSCQISAWPKSGHFPLFTCSAGRERLIWHEMLTTQDKNISEDFIDFWFNCVRLLNHVKVTHDKPFTPGWSQLLAI